jgi:uncharacterized protein YjbI with pentapeptide repeats
MEGTDLSDAILTTVVSGGITGTPGSLPTNWELLDGYLIGPGTNLTDDNLQNADLAGVDLANADLTGAILTGADLAGANLAGVLWSDTTCPDGTNSDNDGETCVNNLG